MGFLYVQIRFRKKLKKKLKIVKEAKKLNIKKSTYLANKYDISVDTVESLVNRFEAFGIEG
ncbi:IS1296IE transposase protein A [Mycoplasma mycoides subsp. mycoides]|nr:IS1296IE transposase protein A [Mycoplasma mycoides subsp. mycoides]